MSTPTPDTDDLVSKYPAHVPMGLPLPQRPPDATHDRDDKDYTL